MRRIIFFACLFFLLLSTVLSCNMRNNAVFFAEKYWWDLIARETNLKQKLEKLCADSGFNFKLIIVDSKQDYTAQLTRAASGPRVKLIITGPLMSDEVNAVAKDYTDKQFVVIGASEYFTFTAPHVISLHFDQEEAYTRAGKILRTLLGPAYYYMYENLEGKNVGIIYSHETDKAREEVENFKNAFLQGQPADRLLLDSLENPNDRVEAVRAVDALFSKNVRIFVLKVYGLIPACIQKIVSLDSYYIIEDWQYLQEYGDHLLFSIEEDIPSALAAALQFMRAGENPFSPVPGKDISVPCKIYWGEAIKPPAELNNSILFRKNTAH